MMELLAPAGSPEALIAAVQGGADAVYMGFGAFNARRSAQNFTTDSFAEGVRYCHVRGTKVYLTLNTLLSDRELPQAAELLRTASRIGVDAVLVQDWGVLQLARAVAPDLTVHASTQMSLHTLSGANRAHGLGMERVVLSRELSREEIAEICNGCDAEIEAFVHGALCMCYSGQCAMSALIGQRSGNRGRCAQPCRLPYGVNGPCGDKHPLSLKDNNLSAYLEDMRAMGVACLKLEGRMKRPEYVYAITSIYRRLIDQRRGPTAEESRLLASAFSRDGFTDGYWTGKLGKAMFGMRPASERWPEEWFAELRREYEKGPRTVPVTMTATLQAGAPAALTVSDGTNTLTVTGDVPEAARNRALTADDLSARLQKTGGTAFSVSECMAVVEDGLMLSASAINGLRREALAALEERRGALPERREGPDPAPITAPVYKNAPQFTVSLCRIEQLTEELVALSPAIIYLPIELLDKVDFAKYPTAHFCAVLPRIYRTKDEGPLRALLEKHACHLEGVTVGNLGHLAIVEGLPLSKRGDFSLNVFNARSVDFWREQGLDSVTLSFELRYQQVREMAKTLPCEGIVYGNLPLMIMESCPLKAGGQCSQGKGGSLTDRTGATFPTLCAYGCRCEVQNSLPLYLCDKPEYAKAGFTYARLRFTTESPRECVNILRHHLGLGGTAPEKYTRGLFYRGVE